MTRLLITIFTFSLISVTVWAANCPPPVFTPDSQVKINSETLLIVTHPSTQWDGRYSSKAGMDATVQFAKTAKIPVIYLQDSLLNRTNKTYFFADCNPDYWVSSGGGEFRFEVPAKHVYTVGGHWELCQRTTMSDLMRQWRHRKDTDLTITFVMDGLYTHGGKFRKTDPYYNDFERFMDIIYYGNPRSSWYIRKLNLLESMGIIEDMNLQLEFIKRNLPDYSWVPDTYQVELDLNGHKEILKHASGINPYTLKFEFVNSVYKNGLIPSSVSVN